MADLSASPALLRSLARFSHRPVSVYEQQLADGLATKPVTQAHVHQALSNSAGRIMKATERARKRTTRSPTEREKNIANRRKWGGDSSMPHDIRKDFSEAERAALAIVVQECKVKGFCDLCIEAICARCGVSRTTVQNALRKAQGRDLSNPTASLPVRISVRQRPQQGGKNLPNVIRIVCKTWLRWLAGVIGFKRLNTSETGVKKALSETASPSLSALDREREEPVRHLKHALRVASSGQARVEARSLFDLAGVCRWRR